MKSTSFEVNGSPLLHFKPLRRLKVNVLASGDTVHFSASRGSYSYLSLTISSASKITVMICVSGPLGGASGFQLRGFWYR